MRVLCGPNWHFHQAKDSPGEMPKATRTRLNSGHETTRSSLAKRQFSLPDGHAQRLISSPDTTSANKILEELKGAKAYVSSKQDPSKDQKNPLMTRIRDVAQPYSKSHIKRLKKKMKEQSVVGDLNPVKQALEDILAEESKLELSSRSGPVGRNSTAPERSKTAPVTSVPPTKVKKCISQKQRAQVLREESIRLPNVLKHPEFRKNPFAAIRTHVQNSSNV